MVKYISLLRGINVSGKNKIKMEQLKELYESLGFSNVQTYIQSGNVVFENSKDELVVSAKKIEKMIAREFGYSVMVTIRTKRQLEEIISHSPFDDKMKKDISKLYVTFLSDKPSKSSLDSIVLPGKITEKWFVVGQEIFLFCPDGYGRTKLNNNFFEKKIKLSATTRNWRTVNKLLEMLG